jgi:hypothetical protein
MHFNQLKLTANLESNKTKTRRLLMQASPIEVQKSLKDIDYPVRKKDLIQHAKMHGASDKVLAVLESLPEKEYHSATDVSREFKGK